MSNERLAIWSQPAVVERLREGEQLADILCFSCPACGTIGYYDGGSSFSCAKERCGWHWSVANEQDLWDEAWCIEHPHHVNSDDALTLEDVADAECSDYP